MGKSSTMKNIQKKDITEFIIMLLERKKPMPKNNNIEKLNFYESGHVDSLGMMKFIVQIEEKYDIEISESDMMKDDFVTIEGIVNLLHDKIQDR
ncbi:MAG: acyl carrier protein [Candidatus Electrothrix sp. AR1]|nr:acyl carrier protein [Candidatus Electrothrix sp. AR1]